MALRQFASQAAGALRVRCGPSIHSGFSSPFFRSMSTVLDDFKYAESHEWVKVDGEHALVGISDHAQSELGDIVHVEVKPSVDEAVEKGSILAVVESVKAASDVYAPVSGTIVEINETLDGSKNPEQVNASPFEAGWFAKIKLSSPEEVDTLLGANEYKEHVEKTAH